MRLTRQQLDNVRIARHAARKAGINPHLFLRQMQQEAHFNDLTSSAGAQGPAQIMPATARGWGVANVHDPHQAYTAAAQHMAGYLHAYGGDWAKALTAYNAGPGAVGRPLPAETQGYIHTILGGHDVVAPPAAKLEQTDHITKGKAPTLTPGSQKVDTQGAVAAALLDPRKKMSLASRILENVTSGNYTKTIKPKVTPGTAPKYAVTRTAKKPVGSRDNPKGVASFEGVKVAAWIKPALAYARKHGWKGSVTSGYRSLADQTRIYNSGVRPAAKPGTSNHEGSDFPRGAVDVSDAAQLASILQASPYAKKLIYAGAKDPVHFSHPHNGGY